MKKPSSVLYNLARKVGKTASKMNDIETLLTLNPSKIVKRIARKTTYKATNSVARKINKNLR
jgi:hypothetical protein